MRKTKLDEDTIENEIYHLLDKDTCESSEDYVKRKNSEYRKREKRNAFISYAVGYLIATALVGQALFGIAVSIKYVFSI
jgi:quinol-cytochrome oxidoreductase complex cytochrome b subunit